LKKIALVLIMALILFTSSSPTFAMDVSGIVDSDTTWSKNNSPYQIVNTVQIARNVTLTIEPGVIVNGAGVIFDIKVYGSLLAIGYTNERIIFNNVSISRGDGTEAQDARVEIQFADFNITECNVWLPQMNGTFSSFILRDSRAVNTANCGTSWSIAYPKSPCYVERNVFRGYMNLGINTGTADAPIYVKNNLFQNRIGNAISIDWSSDSTKVIIEYNSFLDTKKIALNLNPGRTTYVTATNNFWNTTDTNIIDGMIYDKKDDLACTSFVVYTPFLTAPHPDTPANQSPIAVVGGDQVVVSSVTLDGSQSYDPDGTINIYNWTFTHRTNSSLNLTAAGQKPTINNLSPGFYDVTLTVTDNYGLTNTSTIMLLLVLPVNTINEIRNGWYSQQQLDQAVMTEKLKYDPNGDGKIGLQEVIYYLQILSGVR
jgi:hypothetical protein